MKIFIFDPLWDELIADELAAKLESIDAELIVTKDIKSLRECKELFEGGEERMLCLNPDYVAWKLDADDYKDIPNLKVILGAATSFSWIDTSYADKQDIPICNIRNFSTQAVAEWAITMMHNVARQVPRLIKDKFPLDYDKDFMKYRGVELRGKTAGIIGLGNIGTAIAERCEGLGMNVVYWSRSEKPVEYTKMSLEQLVRESDVIFPAMALNDETKGLLSDELLSTVKPSAMLISVVHDIFNEEKAVAMVGEGKLFGLGFESAPAGFDNFSGNIWAAPAYAWVTKESMDNSMALWVQNIVDASKQKYPNRVN